MVHCGMGFSTDAYDLLIIGYILATIQDAYNYAGIVMPGFTEYLVGPNSAFWTGLLASIALWAAILGQLIFGYLGDRWGRKKVYGLEATLLSLGALLSAFSPMADNIQIYTGLRNRWRLPNFSNDYERVAALMITSGTKVTGFLIPAEVAFLLYALSFFFIDFGPNSTTFVISTEVYPVRFRTTGHGISAASGKLGAAVTTYLFPSLLGVMGIKNLLIMLAVVSVIGALITFFFLPETKNRSLEEIAKEELVIPPTSQ